MSTLKRQGDILLEKVDGVQVTRRTPVEDGVIARGEVTGHAHRVENGELALTNAGHARLLRRERHGRARRARSP